MINTQEAEPSETRVIPPVCEKDKNLLALYELFRMHYFNPESKVSYTHDVIERGEKASGLKFKTSDGNPKNKRGKKIIFDENNSYDELVHRADGPVSDRDRNTIAYFMIAFYKHIINGCPQYKQPSTETLERKLGIMLSECNIVFNEIIDHNPQGAQIAKYFELSTTHTDGRTFQFLIEFHMNEGLENVFSCLIHIPENGPDESEVDFSVFDVPVSDIKRHEYAFLRYYLALARQHITLSR